MVKEFFNLYKLGIFEVIWLYFIGKLIVNMWIGYYNIVMSCKFKLFFGYFKIGFREILLYKWEVYLFFISFEIVWNIEW